MDLISEQPRAVIQQHPAEGGAGGDRKPNRLSHLLSSIRKSPSIRELKDQQQQRLQQKQQFQYSPQSPSLATFNGSHEDPRGLSPWPSSSSNTAVSSNTSNARKNISSPVLSQNQHQQNSGSGTGTPGAAYQSRFGAGLNLNLAPGSGAEATQTQTQQRGREPSDQYYIPYRGPISPPPPSSSQAQDENKRLIGLGVEADLNVSAASLESPIYAPMSTSPLLAASHSHNSGWGLLSAGSATGGGGGAKDDAAGYGYSGLSRSTSANSIARHLDERFKLTSSSAGAPPALDASAPLHHHHSSRKLHPYGEVHGMQRAESPFYALGSQGHAHAPATTERSILYLRPGEGNPAGHRQHSAGRKEAGAGGGGLPTSSSLGNLISASRGLEFGDALPTAYTHGGNQPLNNAPNPLPAVMRLSDSPSPLPERSKAMTRVTPFRTTSSAATAGETPPHTSTSTPTPTRSAASGGHGHGPPPQAHSARWAESSFGGAGSGSGYESAGTTSGDDVMSAQTSMTSLRSMALPLRSATAGSSRHGKQPSTSSSSREAGSIVYPARTGTGSSSGGGGPHRAPSAGSASPGQPTLSLPTSQAPSFLSNRARGYSSSSDAHSVSGRSSTSGSHAPRVSIEPGLRVIPPSPTAAVGRSKPTHASRAPLLSPVPPSTLAHSSWEGTPSQIPALPMSPQEPQAETLKRQEEAKRNFLLLQQMHLAELEKSLPDTGAVYEPEGTCEAIFAPKPRLHTSFVSLRDAAQRQEMRSRTGSHAATFERNRTLPRRALSKAESSPELRQEADRQRAISSATNMYGLGLNGGITRATPPIPERDASMRTHAAIEASGFDKEDFQLHRQADIADLESRRRSFTRWGSRPSSAVSTGPGQPFFHHRAPPPPPKHAHSASDGVAALPPKRGGFAGRFSSLTSRPTAEQLRVALADGSSAARAAPDMWDSLNDVPELATVIAQGEALDRDRAKWRKEFDNSIGRSKSREKARSFRSSAIQDPSYDFLRKSQFSTHGRQRSFDDSELDPRGGSLAQHKIENQDFSGRGRAQTLTLRGIKSHGDLQGMHRRSNTPSPTITSCGPFLSSRPSSVKGHARGRSQDNSQAVGGGQKMLRTVSSGFFRKVRKVIHLSVCHASLTRPSFTHRSDPRCEKGASRRLTSSELR